MKKIINSIIIVLIMIIASFNLIACGRDNNPSPQIVEYYEIEYQDGSGVHIAKAIGTLLVAEINIYTIQTKDNVTDYIKWEYIDKFNFCFRHELDEEIGVFNDFPESYLGYIKFYYGEVLHEEYYSRWGSSYAMQNQSTQTNIFLSAAGKNIVINNQNITHFNIYQIKSNDAKFRLEAKSDNKTVKTEDIIIRIEMNYEPTATWEIITLEEDGDFTSIIRNEQSLATIRTENILRKVVYDR